MGKANKIIIPLLLALVVMAAGSATPVSAAEAAGRPKVWKMMGHKKLSAEEMAKKKAEMEAKQTAIDKAMADNNYTAWVAAVGADSELAKKLPVISLLSL